MLSDDSTFADYAAGQMAGELVLGIAADVFRSFGTAMGTGHLALIGGIVPTIRVPEPPEGLDRHVGTSDLDIHLSLHLLEGATADYYLSIVEGLRSLDLKPAEQAGRTRRWQWVGTHRGARLSVDLLCPEQDRGGVPAAPSEGTPAEVNIGPADTVAALQLGMGALVPIDTVEVHLRVPTADGDATFPFPIAGLVSWLCLKSDALVRRRKFKDAYDIVWLLTSLGPEAAAQEVAESPILGSAEAGRAIEQLTLLIDDQFADIASIGPRSYAAFLKHEPAADARDALGAVRAFGAALRHAGVGLS